MPYYYLDSTALVKRYSMERGTRIINRLMVKRSKVVILPTWSVTDFYTRDDCYSVIHKFERESQEGLYQFIAPTMQTYLATKELALEYPGLRTPQVLHLALALELKPLRLTVVSADAPLLTACHAVGLHTINPEED
jgi:hypothetical protein